MNQREIPMSIEKLVMELLHSFAAFVQSIEIKEKQKKVRSKLIDSSDSSSFYRAMDVRNQLENLAEEQVQTLTDTPDLCFERFPDKETMGVRQIIDVDDKKQPNGKMFNKYLLGEYQFRIYREACQPIENIGREFLLLGIEKGDRVLIEGEIRPE